MRRRRTQRGAALALLAAALAGCAAPRKGAAPVATAPQSGAPSPQQVEAYDDIATRWNARAADLARIWARAVVQIEFIDADGDRRNEQGEGHLQLIQPAQFALSIGKLGEVMLWLGADASRYWVIEPGDASRASVGSDATLGLPCHRSLGLPAHPLDILDLMGVTPLPLKAEVASRNLAPPWATRTRDGRLLVVEAPGRLARRRMFLDPETLLPRRIQLFASDRPSQVESAMITADLTDPEPVTLRDRGGFFPRVASRIAIVHTESDTRIVLHLSDMSDGRDRSGRLSPRVFDFDSLTSAFGIARVDRLDADCDRLASPAPAEGAGP